MQNPVIAIVGIGKARSVGYHLSLHIVGNPGIMGVHQGDQQGIGMLLLNDRDTAEKKTHVNDFIKDHLYPSAEKNKTIDCMYKVRYARLNEIFEKADIIYFCYNAYKDVLFWEPDNRMKFFPANKDATETGIVKPLLEYAGTKPVKDYLKGQIVFVTNPTLQLATYFQKETTLEPGQIVAFAPENHRLMNKLRPVASTRVPELQKYVTAGGSTNIFIIGEHGSNAMMVLPDGFCVPGFYDPAIKERQLAHSVLNEVLQEGQHIRHGFDSTGANIAPYLAELISDALKGNGPGKNVFCWGVEQDGVYCALPFYNFERDLGNSQSVLRARVCQKYLDDIVNGRCLFVYP
jgi:hypothetical protein